MASLFKRFSYGRFGGGINTAVPASEIADDECVDILNKIFDQEDNLVTRRGVVAVCSAMPVTPSNRITSLFDYQLNSGSQFLVATWGAELRSITSVAATSIKGALTLPTDTLWSWIGFNGLAIGANGASSGDAVVQWNGTGNATALGGSPPRMKNLEVWNNRVFGVEVAAPNRISWCKLGDANDWTDVTAGSIEVGYDDNDYIVALKAHRKSLFIFKRKTIHVLTAGTPNTDTALWKLDIFAKKTGAVSANSIWSVLDDLFFLSDSGVLALSATPSFGDFDTGTVSAKVNALRTFNRSIPNHYAVVDPQNSQYWIAVPNSTSGTENGEVYIADFKHLKEGRIRWTRGNGGVVGSAYAQVMVSGKQRVYVGTTGNQIFRYDDTDVYSDNSVGYSKMVATKAFSQDAPSIRKEFQRWFAAIELLSCPVAVTVRYRFDERDYLSASQAFNFECVEDGQGGFFGDGSGNANAALWDVAIWDATDGGVGGIGFTFGGEVSDASSSLRDIQRKFSQDNGKRGQTVQFFFSNAQVDQAFKLMDFAVDAVSIGIRKVSDT